MDYVRVVISRDHSVFWYGSRWFSHGASGLDQVGSLMVFLVWTMLVLSWCFWYGSSWFSHGVSGMDQDGSLMVFLVWIKLVLSWCFLVWIMSVFSSHDHGVSGMDQDGSLMVFSGMDYVSVVISRVHSVSGMDQVGSLMVFLVWIKMVLSWCFLVWIKMVLSWCFWYGSRWFSHGVSGMDHVDVSHLS